MKRHITIPLILSMFVSVPTFSQDTTRLPQSDNPTVPEESFLGPSASHAPQVGIAVDELSDQLKEHLNIADGVFVRLVVADSAAARAGIREGDLLMRVNGETIAHATDLLFVIQSRKVGDTLSCELIRGGTSVTAKVTLIESPSAPAVSNRPGLGLGLGDFLQKQLEQLGTRLDDQVDVNRLDQIEQLLGRKIFDVRRGAAVANAKTLHIEIDRSGSGPAVIRVTRDGKTIEANSDAINKLPDDIRDMLEPLLGSGNRLKIDLGGMVIEVPYTEAKPTEKMLPGIPAEVQRESSKPTPPTAPLVPPAMNLPRKPKSAPETVAPPQAEGKPQTKPRNLDQLQRKVDAMRQELESLQQQLNGS